MKFRVLSYFILVILFPGLVLAQSISAPVFPQQQINKALNSFHLSNNKNTSETTPATSLSLKSFWNSYNTLEKFRHSFRYDYNRNMAPDTVFVGVVPNDTLVINGNYFNNGPILVFNDGVLIFDHATATIIGDVYVFQQGRLLADSSTLNFPQQY